MSLDSAVSAKPRRRQVDLPAARKSARRPYWIVNVVVTINCRTSPSNTSDEPYLLPLGAAIHWTVPVVDSVPAPGVARVSKNDPGVNSWTDHTFRI